MELDEFKKILRQVAENHNFSHKSGAYFWTNEEIIIAISIQKSRFSEAIYLNFGVMVKSIHPEIRYPKDYNCDLRGRFAFKKWLNGQKVLVFHPFFFKSRQSRGDIYLKNYSEVEVIENLNRNFKQEIEPIMVADSLKSYLEKDSRRLPTSTISLRQYLGIEAKE